MFDETGCVPGVDGEEVRAETMVPDAKEYIRLDKFVYDPKKGSGSVAVDAAKGAFRFVTGSQKKGNYKVNTPYGTIGMRG